MSISTKFCCSRNSLKLAVDLLSIKNKDYISPLLFHSYNFNFFKSNSLDILNKCNSKRKFMDLTTIVNVFEEKMPSHLAEPWDNTGLLIEPSNKCLISTILFTNDLTEVVLQEALDTKSNLILSYHPPIFAPMKSLKQLNWKDRIVIKCLENSVAVYSPHTSCDAVGGGVNDWLINSFDLSESTPILQSYECRPKYSHMVEFTATSSEEIVKRLKVLPDSEFSGSSVNADKQNFRLKVNKKSLNNLLQLLTDTGDATSISVTALNPLPILSCGMGRIGKLVKPLTLGDCIKLIKNYLKLDFIRFSQSASHSLESLISTVAVCAGSGSSVLKGVNADLYITGEMSHHDLLDANHRDVSVILCEHSNSERGYLKHLAEALSPKLKGVNLIISSSDKDPISII